MSKSEKDIFQTLVSPEPDQEYQLMIMEELRLARQAAARQGPFYLLLFHLRFEQDLRPRETAEIIGESENYVNVYTHKLRNKIRAELRR